MLNSIFDAALWPTVDESFGLHLICRTLRVLIKLNYTNPIILNTQNLLLLNNLLLLEND